MTKTIKTAIDYKDADNLKRYLSERGKILPRQKTGLNAYGQRTLTLAVKRARFMGLISPVIEVVR